MVSAALYIHIPFCKSKCTYCDFFSVPLADTYSISDEFYKNNLLHELHLRRDFWGIEQISSIYIGGGTPSILPASFTAHLLDGIKKKLFVPSDCEITMEANPDDITETMLHELQLAGINRLSLGIQSLHDKSLQTVKRRSSRQKNLEALDLIQRYFSGTFSVDLIAGLPEETTSSFMDGLETLVLYCPHHVSMYNLTIEEGTVLHQQVNEGLLIDDQDFAEQLWDDGAAFLKEAGYQQYEVSNFAFAGNECIHNMSYWKMKNYLGLGPGAVGTIDALRYQNTDSIELWMNTLQKAESAADLDNCQQVELLSTSTQITEFLMMGFRTLSGVCQKEFSRRFNAELTQYIEPQFSLWAAKGLAEKTGEQYHLTPQGLRFLNTFLTSII